MASLWHRLFHIRGLGERDFFLMLSASLLLTIDPPFYLGLILKTEWSPFCQGFLSILFTYISKCLKQSMEHNEH